VAISAVVFDLFGTLIDDSPPADYGRFLGETATELGVDPELFEAAWNRNDIARYTSPVDDSLTALAAELGVTDRARIDAALRLRVERLRALLVPRPDAVSTLRALRRRGFRLGMISNATSEVSGLWAETAFEPLFDAVLFSADERMMKPDRRLYERMAALLGVEPDKCLFVGDGAYRELQGAAEAGMTPILIRAPHDQWEHEGTIDWDGQRVSALSEVLALV
jgi:putative hydrolase of the HAD superfamily